MIKLKRNEYVNAMLKVKYFTSSVSVDAWPEHRTPCGRPVISTKVCCLHLGAFTFAALSCAALSSVLRQIGTSAIAAVLLCAALSYAALALTKKAR